MKALNPVCERWEEIGVAAGAKQLDVIKWNYGNSKTLISVFMTKIEEAALIIIISLLHSITNTAMINIALLTVQY